MPVIITSNELTLIGRNAFEAVPQAIETDCLRLVGMVSLCETIERPTFAGPLFLYFEENESRHAEAILRELAYLLSLRNSFRDAVDGFIRVVFGKRAAAPLE